MNGDLRIEISRVRQIVLSENIKKIYIYIQNSIKN